MYVIDTNAYSAYFKEQELIVGIISGEPEVGITLPTIAELRYGFVRGNRPDWNEDKLQEFLSKPNVQMFLPTLETTRHYAEIQQFCRLRGRSLSQNDIWIAAIVRSSEHTLLTFDKDFEALDEVLYGRVRILEYPGL